MIIFAAGAWIVDYFPDLALPLRGERQVFLWFRPKGDPAAFGADRLPIVGWDQGDSPDCYMIPDVGHGVKAVQHHGGELTHPDRMKRKVTSEDELHVRNFLRGHVPLLDSHR